MKKLFTLMVMALVAMSVSAKEPIDFTKISGFAYGTAFKLGTWDWKGVTLAQGEPVKDEAAKTADDSNVTYYDASAYDYVVVKYTASTIDVSLIAQYKCKGTIGQYGTEFNQGQSTIGASTEATYAALELDATQKKTVNQIAIQSGSTAGEITIDEVYFATKDEWEAVKPKPAQTKDMMASVKGIANAKTNDDGTVTLTGASAWAWLGMWLGSFDASAFDYVVLELAEPADFTVQLAIQHNVGDDVSGQIPAGETLMKVKLSENKNAIKQMALQNAAVGSFTVKAFYFATQDYVDNMSKPTTKNLPLSNLSSGWNATYDAASKLITIGDEKDEGGKGWWYGSADFSDFDNVVVEFEETTVGGKVVVEYEDAAASRRAEAVPGEFGVGATCVVVPLDATKKAAVKQIYITGAKGSTYTLKAAYAAVASATPEANLGKTESGETAKPVMISWGADDIAAKGSLDGKTYGEDFKLTITDTNKAKLEIDANNAYFGDATTQIKFTHRLKTGGKSDSKNNMALTIPSDGTLKVYVRTGSSSATDRNLVLTQGESELYNKVVKEADAVEVDLGNVDGEGNPKKDKVYPVIEVAVKAGTVAVTYPTNSLNFYGFEFVSGTTGIQQTIAPAKVIENNVIYNLAGQKVNESYKGIVIKNGKKFIQK